MGNICRSPTAEGVFRRVLAARAPELEIEIDSAGTHDYHVGSPPDRRAIQAARRRGVDLSGLRARMVSAEDFGHYDLILAMDEDVSALRNLTRREREVLAHLVTGRSYTEIAEALFISDKTVSVHVSNILRKTGARNRVEASALGRRHGVVAES